MISCILTIQCINVGTQLVHVVPLDYPYLLLVPRPSAGDYRHLSIYSFAPSNILGRLICTLRLSDEESRSENGVMLWYKVHTGNRPQTSEGHFHADLSLSMVVLTFDHEYREDASQRLTHYLIPRATLLAQIHHAESQQTQTDSDSRRPGPAMQAVPWADWGPQGCLRLSRRNVQVQLVVAMPFGTRFPLFVVDESDSRSASVYVFDINPYVARYQRQVLAARKHDPATGTSMGTIIEDIEAVLPGVVDPHCSSIPYIVYRFPLPYAPEEWHVRQFIRAVVMGMTGFTVKVSICAMSSWTLGSNGP